MRTNAPSSGQLPDIHFVSVKLSYLSLWVVWTNSNFHIIDVWKFFKFKISWCLSRQSPNLAFSYLWFTFSSSLWHHFPIKDSGKLFGKPLCIYSISIQLQDFCCKNSPFAKTILLWCTFCFILHFNFWIFSVNSSLNYSL